MSIETVTELQNFRQYLDQRLTDGSQELSPEEALRDWREHQQTIQSIRRGLADVEAGRTRPAVDVIEELRARLTRP